MKVVLAVDQSRDAKLATRFLETIRLPRGTALSILHVIEVPPMAIRYPGQQHMLADWRKDATTSARLLIGRIAIPLTSQGLRVRPLVKAGVPRPGLLSTVERTDTDLVVMGSKGLTGLDRYLFGSVTRKVARHVPCSVLVVRRRAMIRSLPGSWWPRTSTACRSPRMPSSRRRSLRWRWSGRLRTER